MFFAIAILCIALYPFTPLPTSYSGNRPYHTGCRGGHMTMGGLIMYLTTWSKVGHILGTSRFLSINWNWLRKVCFLLQKQICKDIIQIPCGCSCIILGIGNLKNLISREKQKGVIKMEMEKGGVRKREKWQTIRQSNSCLQSHLRPGQRSNQPGPSVS